jgi:hypothetical protein
MFDSYRHQDGDTHVTIKQQPNDAADAARLHGEIRDKAIAEANSAIVERLGAHNEFIVAKVRHEVHLGSLDKHVRAIFTINGKPYDVSVTVPEELSREIRRVIAVALLEEIMRGLERRL